MNFANLISGFGTELDSATANISTTLDQGQITDPQQMLEQQYLYQNYSNLVAFYSAITKRLGDTVAGIVSKI